MRRSSWSGIRHGIRRRCPMKPSSNLACCKEIEVATKTRERPAALSLTAGAEARIAELMAKAPEGAIGVKLSTPRRGCSGLAYSVDYVTEEKPFDEKIETPGGNFYVDGA